MTQKTGDKVMKVAPFVQPRAENQFSNTRLPAFIAPGRDEWRGSLYHFNIWSALVVTFACIASLFRLY